MRADGVGPVVGAAHDALLGHAQRHAHGPAGARNPRQHGVGLEVVGDGLQEAALVERADAALARVGFAEAQGVFGTQREPELAHEPERAAAAAHADGAGVVAVRDAVGLFDAVFEEVRVVEGHLLAAELGDGHGREQQLQDLEDDLDEVFVAVVARTAAGGERKQEKVHLPGFAGLDLRAGRDFFVGWRGREEEKWPEMWRG